MKDLTRQELLTILHVRTQALEEIRHKYAEGVEPMVTGMKMNILAGHALIIGPNASALCAMAEPVVKQTDNGGSELRAPDLSFAPCGPLPDWDCDRNRDYLQRLKLGEKTTEAEYDLAWRWSSRPV